MSTKRKCHQSVNVIKTQMRDDNDGGDDEQIYNDNDDEHDDYY